MRRSERSLRTQVSHSLRHAWTALVAVAFMAVSTQALAMRTAWTHDRDADKIDDRIERVREDGFAASFERADVFARQVIAVSETEGDLHYGVYIGYEDAPTAADLQDLRAIGLTALKPYKYIDYVRATATYVQLEAIAELPRVRRIESIPMVYSTNHYGARVVRARDSRGLSKVEDYALFPSVRQELGLDGTGVVVAVLDTGVNDDLDEVNPTYPGHESLHGKFLGGGEFYFGQPLLNTGLDDSMNPQDHGSAGSSYHATHVAGSAIGNGGETGFFAGVAPAARLVDCKVLSDAGVGFGSADGVEWCIHNKNNDWGLTGDDAIYAGIDVLNLSLGGLDASDGTDAGSQMINAAVTAGLIVCIATGNDGNVDHISAPAAADLCIAVGASSHASTLDRTDDQVTDFSNEGPRADDGDSDAVDEMKPSVVAPGEGILSANGDFTTQGEAYQRLGGTSMSTPHVAGVCALLKQLDPGIDPLELRAILQNTAIHNIPSVKGDRANDPFGIDPNYDPGCGWGLVDTYAAAKEIIDAANGVQVVRIRAVARPLDGEIDVHWWTQREYSFQGFNVYRAPDAGGAPGPFAKINGAALVAPAGDPVIEADGNRTSYTYVDDDALLVDGETYWYQVRWVASGGAESAEPPVPVTFGTAPRIATVFYSVAHNAVDNDLTVRIGRAQGYDLSTPEYLTLGAGSTGADSIVTIEPANAATATSGYLDHFWSIGLTEADGVAGFLPPAEYTPWFLDVEEGGYINRFGRVTSFSMFVNDSPGSPSGTVYLTDTVLPLPTIETASVTAWIPTQNPVSSAGVARFEAEGTEGGIRVIFQLQDPQREARLRIARTAGPDPVGLQFLNAEPLVSHNGTVEFLDSQVVADRDYWYWAEFDGWSDTPHLAGPVAARFDGALARTFLRLRSSNPMRANARLAFTVGRDIAGEGQAPVTVSIHDVQGRRIRTLLEDRLQAGAYEVDWNGARADGPRVGPGVYFVRFRAGEHQTTAKLTVVD